MSYPLLSAGIMNSIFFGVYGNTLETIKKARYESEVENHNHKPSKLDIFLAGCVAGAAQLIVACPVDLVKIKLQTQNGHGGAMLSSETHFKGPFHILKQLYLQQGIRGCYKGLAPMFVR